MNLLLPLFSCLICKWCSVDQALSHTHNRHKLVSKHNQHLSLFRTLHVFCTYLVNLMCLASLSCIEFKPNFAFNAFGQLITMIRNRVRDCPDCGAYSITKEQAICVEIFLAFEKQFLNKFSIYLKPTVYSNGLPHMQCCK